MRPVAEIMFSDFLACCWDYLANEIPKVRYMTGGQVTVPLVVRTANGGGLGFGAQHSQAVENWAFTVPGLKIAAPSTPADVVGPDGVRDPQRRPGGLLRAQGPVREQGSEPAPDGHVVPLGEAASRPARSRRHPGGARVDGTGGAGRGRAAWPATACRSRSSTCAAWCRWTCRRCSPRSARTSRLLIVEENPYQGGWGGTVASIVADEGFESLDAPIRRVAAACVPLPFADALEDEVIPTVDKVVEAVRQLAAY